MSLIERLGGYDAVKEYLKKNSHLINFEGLESFYDEFLEYRREHNIYEVGDYFCYESKYPSDDPLDGNEYAKLHRLDSLDFECGFVDLVVKRGGIIRHATDEEIKAGRRL